MAHVKVAGELQDFARQVPEKAAEPNAFDGQSLFRTMVGIRIAAGWHAKLITDTQHQVAAADSGLEAYKQAAATIDANYTGTDALNQQDLKALDETATKVLRPLDANRMMAGADSRVVPGMVAPADADPAKDPRAWWKLEDGQYTMPGIGMGTAPPPLPAGTELPNYPDGSSPVPTYAENPYPLGPT